MNDFYLKLNYSPLHLLDAIHQEASQSSNYYLSPVGVLRCDVSDFLNNELRKIINVPIADCGFLKTQPGQAYPIHKDVFRIAAINMPLFDNTEEFQSFVFVNGQFKLIDYSLNSFTMLNVCEFHGVKNKSTSSDRIILSIGIKSHSYKDLKHMFNNNELLNITV
jgi:hypothetical protein